MTDEQEKTAPVETVAAKVIRPFFGVIDADGAQGWAHPGETIEVTPARRAELLSAEQIEREDGDPAPDQDQADPIDARRDKTRKLKVSGGDKA